MEIAKNRSFIIILRCYMHGKLSISIYDVLLSKYLLVSCVSHMSAYFFSIKRYSLVDIDNKLVCLTVHGNGGMVKLYQGCLKPV